ncbi:MAG: toxins and related Ca2+-binding domain, partial [Verrucomicrobiota bacterium]
MKPKNLRSPFLSTALLTALLASQSASAADIVWGAILAPGPFDWNTGSNWVGGTAPTTDSDRADLRKDWTTAATINLSAPITISGILYNDSGSSGDVIMTIGNGGTAANTLTLNTVTKPYLEVTSALVVSAVIEGTQGFTKGNGGTLTLSGLNTYSGGTTVMAGALSIGSVATTSGTAVTANATGTGDVTLANGTTILTTAGTSVWYVPTLTLQGNVSLSSGSRLTTSFGTLELSSGTRALNVNNRFIAVTGGNTVTSEATGGAQLEMNATAIQSATPVVQNGTLSLQSTSGSATPSNPGLLSIRGATNWTNASLVIGSNNMLMFNSFSSSGSNALGTSATTSPAVTVDGYLNMASSTIPAGKNFKVQSLAGSGKVFPSMLLANTSPGTLTINGDTGSTEFSGLLANGPGTGALSITKTGASTQILSGVNTYTGLTTVSAGTLTLSGGGTLGNGAALTMSGGTLDLGAGGATVGAVSITAAAASGNTIQNGSLTGASYAASSASGNAVVSANLQANDTAGLTKTGAGTLTLSGANTYTGTTIVNGGVLDVGAIDSGSLGGGGLTLGNGAVLQGNGSFTRSFSNSLVAGAGQVSANNGSVSSPGGFSAKGGPLTVNFGGAGASLQINSGAYRFGQGFVFGSATADNKVTVLNPLDLGNGNRTFTVQSGLGGDSAEIVNGIKDTGLDQLSGPIKAGPGLLVLNGVNAYGGNTLVNAGTLQLADNATLKFKIGASSGVSNYISGAGEVILDGDFIVDTTAAAALTTGSWTLENVDTLTGAYGTTFSVVGFTDAGSDKWTKVEGTQSWTFDETTGELTLAVGSTANYASWATDKGITGEPATGDFDNDGL